MLTRFPGFRFRSIAVGFAPFDWAQGAHPAATATPSFQSGVGFVVLEVVLDVNHYVFVAGYAGAKV